MQKLDIREFSIPASPLRMEFGQRYVPLFDDTPDNLFLEDELLALKKIEKLTGPVRQIVEETIIGNKLPTFDYARIQGEALVELVRYDVPITKAYEIYVSQGILPLDLLLSIRRTIT